MGNKTPANMKAIKFAKKNGRDLQMRHPEIADDYRAEVNRAGIVKKYDLCNLYNIGEQTALTLVHYALAGNDQNINFPIYEGLIPREEMKILSRQHQVAQGKKLKADGKGIWGRTPKQKKKDNVHAGTSSYDQKKGLHGLSEKRKKKVAKKAGKRSFKLKVGIHGRDNRQVMKDSSKGGKRGAEAQGFTPWQEGEKLLLYILSKSEAYTTSKGLRNKPSAELINNLWHDGEEIRTPGSCSANLMRYKKRYRFFEGEVPLEEAVEFAKELN
jgi:hypothetical protein